MDGLENLKEIMPLLNQINDAYSFLNIPGYEFEQLVFDVVSHMDNKKYKFIVHEIKNRLDQITLQRLSDSKEAISVINGFISDCLEKDESIDEMELFNRLNSFFKKYDYIPSEEVLTSILDQNKSFLRLIERLDKKYNDPVSENDFQDVLNNPTLMQALENYDKVSFGKQKDLSFDDDAFSSDSTRAYLNEIGRIDLLSAEEEKELFQKVKAGDPKAREDFIKSNLRWVVSVAKRYLKRGLSLDDLIEEGNLGLLRAVNDFDVDKGYKFSTYSYFWIRQYILRAIGNTGKSVRIPIHTLREIDLFKKARSYLFNHLGKDPTLGEIAEKMNCSLEKVAYLEAMERKTEIVSINELIPSDEADTELESFIPSDALTPEEVVINASLREQLLLAFKDAKLTPKEQDVLILRFGLDRGVGRRLEEVGKIVGVTRERIRQIEYKALRKLKKPASARRLLPFAVNEKTAAKNVGLDINNGLKFVGPLEDKKSQRKKTIYDHFYHSREDVDLIVSSLSEEDQSVFRFVEDQYEKGDKFDKDQYNKFYKIIRLRIQKKLEFLDEERERLKLAEENSEDSNKTLMKLPDNKKD
ncbi:MAG: sigma-70 family RNA polymerase sigma factor [Bacilli bacterium]|nr:sigma-70 family RNA polymerase sigma factor [Bacilli bacterium]